MSLNKHKQIHSFEYHANHLVDKISEEIHRKYFEDSNDSIDFDFLMHLIDAVVRLFSNFHILGKCEYFIERYLTMHKVMKIDKNFLPDNEETANNLLIIIRSILIPDLIKKLTEERANIGSIHIDSVTRSVGSACYKFNLLYRTSK